MKLSTENLARVSSRYPWRVLGAWLVALVASIAAIIVLLGSALTTEGEIAADVESKRAEQLIKRSFPERGARDESTETIVIVRSKALTVRDQPFRERVESLYEQGSALGGDVVRDGRHYYQDNDESLVSEDRHATLIPFTLAADDKVGELLPLVERADGKDGFDVEAYGVPVVDKDFEELSQHDLKSGELKYGLPAALIILLLVFGTLVAGLVPLLLALLSIAVAVGLAAVVGQAYTLSFFATNVISGMGLALGIDYSLFVLSRYREERAQGRDKFAAIEVAGGTASRAVFFSGLAVALGMFGPVLVPDTIMRSLGIGAILVTAVSVLAGITLMPAILGLLGDRVNAGRLPLVGRAAGADGGGREGRFWAGVARVVMRRPVASVVLAAGLMLAATIPVFDFSTGTQGVSTLPDRLPSKQGFLAFNEAFGAGRINPVLISIDGDVSSPDVRGGIDRLQSALDDNAVFEPGRLEVSKRGDVAALTVPVAGDPVGEQAGDAVKELRSEMIPREFSGVDVEVLVGGETACEIDYGYLSMSYIPMGLCFGIGSS